MKNSRVNCDLENSAGPASLAEIDDSVAQPGVESVLAVEIYLAGLAGDNVDGVEFEDQALHHRLEADGLLGQELQSDGAPAVLPQFVDLA